MKELLELCAKSVIGTALFGHIEKLPMNENR